MSDTLFWIFTAYFFVISIITIAFTYSDKKKAIKKQFRVPEAKLILLGILGGALAEYVTMKKIHHKTLHKKFMIGLPAIIFFQIVILSYIIYLILT